MSAVEMIPQVVMGVVSRAVAQEIGVGMLGYAFMGKAHSNAFRKLTYMTWPPPLVPKLELIAGRNEDAVREAAERYGYERWTTDWHDIVGDPAIGLFDNGGPNIVHAEPTILAAQAGKHVVCEKPLGRDGGRGRVRERSDRDARVDAARARPPQRLPVGDQRQHGLARLRHGTAQRAPGLQGRRRPRARVQDRARQRGEPPVLGVLVAA